MSALDLAVLIRQAVRSFQQRLWVPASIWNPISVLDQRAGLYETAQAGDFVELAAYAWEPSWLPDAGSIDILESRRDHRPAPGTGTLKRAYGFSTYQSEAQKAALEACEFAAPGSTTLVTLPTGGGKSVCTVLPAWRRSFGGTKRGGTTIVIVPTVALAMDQHTAALKYFSSAYGPDFEPHLWTGQTSPERRAQIREGVESGTIPLLFTSPESLLQSSLRSVVVSCAKMGNLASIVIDEAHIVATWGAQFRAEFQILAAFLRQLHLDSGKSLRTILLSATIDVPSERLLQQLFSYGSFTIVRANAVRPEPSWWFDWAENEHVRARHVLDALAHLPRPAILYVTTREDASDWLTKLQEAGYHRVATFTGEMGGTYRDMLLRQWRDDDIDIMVATSAFGLGVDKSDVRTVVHACLPETVDRYYQEVGRGGRDGQSCLSLVCAVPEDADVSFNLTKSSRISTGKAVDRWLGMRRWARSHATDSRLLTIDIDAPPLYALDMSPGETHRDWNMHTLLMLQRTGLLELSSPPSQEGSSNGPESELELHTVNIRTNADAALQGSFDDLYSVLDPFRQAERDYVNWHVQQMSELVRSRSGSPTSPTECVSTVFAGLYPDCTRSCGGCPECRRMGRSAFSEGLGFSIEHDGRQRSTAIPPVHGELATLVGSRARLTVLKPERSAHISSILEALTRNGIVQMVISDEYLSSPEWVDTLVEQLVESAEAPHLIVPESWLRTRYDTELRDLPTAVVYSDSDQDADVLHRAFVEQWKNKPRSTPVVCVIRDGTYLQSESGRFIDRVPGLVIPAQTLLDEVEVTSKGWF
jgi:superfamily II DNA helicase RecQ